MIQRFLILLALAVSLAAAPFTRVVAFGDSLTDNGNLYARVGQTFPPSPPYFAGRATNGPVAVEYLATALGVPLLDFAVYGATSGIGNIFDMGTPDSSNGLPGVLAQYNEALAGGFSVNPADLYVILGGPPNDFRVSGLTPDALQTAITNQITLVLLLQAQGAQNIILGGLTDLGVLPFVLKSGPAAALDASLFSAFYNSELQSALPPGVKFFDVSALIHSVLGDPSFSNKTGFCTDGVNTCANPEQYVFWDEFHPTTRVHEIAGLTLAAAAVPEPAVLLTFASGLGVLVLLRRRAQLK
jgi:cholinesterase